MPPPPIWQSIQPIDLGAMFSGAANMMQLQQMRRQADRQERIDQALQSGDMESWARLDPQGFAAYQAKMRDGQKAEIEQARALQGLSNDVAKRTQEEREFAARTLRANPRSASIVRGRINALARKGVIEPFEIPETTETMGEMAGPPDAMATPQQVAGFERTAGVDPYAKLSGDVRDYLSRHPNDSPDAPGFGDRVDAWDRKNRSSQATTINNNVSATGGSAASPLTAANTTEQNNKLISTRGVIYSLGQLREMGDPAEFLSRGSKFGQLTLSEIDKLAPGSIGPDGEQFIGQAKVYRSRVQQFFNEYRKMITGAGASAQELAQLENSVLNDKLSPAEFKAMLGDTIAKAERDEKIISNLLQRGIPLGSDDFARAFDDARYRGESSAAAGAQADAQMPQPTVTTGKGKNQRTAAAPRMSTGDLRAEAVRNAQSAPGWAQATPQQKEQAIQAYIRLHGKSPQ